MNKLIFIALMLFAVRTSAQMLPDAPKPHLDRTEWALLATDAAVRGLDAYSTHYAISRGATEVVLPGWIANHAPVMALYSGGVVCAQYWVARKLIAHHHRKLAYVVAAADVAITAPSAIHNLLPPSGAVYPASGFRFSGAIH